MPRYYIDVWSRFGVDEDCDGLDVADLTAARAEALRVGHELLERWSEMPLDARSEIIIDVVDERLRRVLRVSLVELECGFPDQTDTNSPRQGAVPNTSSWL